MCLVNLLGYRDAILHQKRLQFGSKQVARLQHLQRKPSKLNLFPGTRICSIHYDVVCQLRKEIPVKTIFQKLNNWPISFNLVIVKSPFLLLRC